MTDCGRGLCLYMAGNSVYAGLFRWLSAKKKELERIKEESGLSWRKFAESFGIPYRTVQDWHLGNRPMPEYILRLMVYKVETEKLLREYKIEKR